MLFSSGSLLNAASLFLFISHIAPAYSSCYWPNGTEKVNAQVKKCPNTNTCCYLNRANNPGNDTQFGDPRDECLPNGLCQNRGTNTTESPPRIFHEYWRDYCADPTWASCPKVCANADDEDRIIKMTPCDGTNTSLTWCCAEDRSCCGGPSEIRIAALSGAQLPSTLSSAITTSVASTFSLSSTTATATSPATAGSSSGSLSTGAKAGIGVGAVSGAALLLIGGIYVVMRKKPKKATHPEPTYTPELMSSSVSELGSNSTFHSSSELMSEEVKEVEAFNPISKHEHRYEMP